MAAEQYRVLLRAATSRDAELTTKVLQRADLQVRVCSTVQSMVEELAQGAGVLMLAEEAMEPGSHSLLQAALAHQEPWSDVPVILLARPGADSSAIGRMMQDVANLTVIERPVRTSALVTATRAALRARRRQYEVRALLRDLHESDQRKTEFLATLAHELRNPLAPLSNALALLQRRVAPQSDDAAQYALMRRQVEHMTRLINDLMEVSRITRNKIQMQFSTLQLSEVIADAIALSKPHVEAAGHHLHVHLPLEPIRVRGDSVRLAQVFANLINNAAKYTPAGGTIEATAMREGTQATVTVKDSGIGIAPHMLDTIFEMFVQAGGSSKHAQGGLGIGLTLAKSLVELHGGRIEAHSEGLNRGACFTVRLPVLDDLKHAESGSARAAKADVHLPGSLTVLVVDDNRDAADTLAAVLELHGMNPLAVYSGAEALGMQGQRQIDVAVLDIGMPQMDGYELAAQLRRAQGDRPLLLIALTGWGQTRDRQRIAEARFDQHLLKPIDVDDLLSLIARWAEREKGNETLPGHGASGQRRS